MRYLALLVMAVALCAAGCGTKETSESKPAATEAKPPATAKLAQQVVKAGSWVKLNSGLAYKDIKVGTGAAVKSGDTVTVHYKGWLDNGTVFDTSKKPGGAPFAFKVGEGMVIPGWDMGIPGLKVGGKRELKIPPSLGYGDMEQPSIPANSTLHFEVELLKIAH